MSSCVDVQFITFLTALDSALFMRALILGSKEYPMGTADGSDLSPSGGMEMYVEGLAAALSKKGVRLTIVTRMFRGAKSDERRGNIRVVRVPFMRGFYIRNPSFNLASFMRALSLDFDVIISNGEVSNFLGLLLSKIKRKPIVMVSHGLASKQPQYNFIVKMLFRIGDRLTYPNADAVVTHAPWQMRGITDKFYVVMPGFDRNRLKKLSLREAKKFRARFAKPDKKIILYTGRVIGVKGLEYLIRSLKYLRHDCKCLIVGDGPDMERMKRLAKEELADVVFTGFRSDVTNFLSIADVFVLPSLSESLNYSLVEAAHMGVPIVCTDIGIIGGDSAILVKPTDEKSLAEGINTALGKGNSRLVANARRYALGFDWSRAAELYIRLMRRLTE